MNPVIADAGPLVAYLKKDDQHHDWAVDRFRELRDPLITCEAALSETLFLLRDVHDGRERLFGMLERGVVIPAFSLRDEVPAVIALLRRYADVPMSLADACLVRMAELSEDAAVFTTDGDFRHYRRHRRAAIPLLFPG